MSRKGKIARLPRTIRNELNERLADGEAAAPVLEWLNALPKTQAVLKKQFHGKPVTEANLSDWRKGGYAEWSLSGDALDDAALMAESGEDFPAAGPLAEQLSTILCTRYNRILAHWDEVPIEQTQQHIRAYGGLCRQVVAVRRAERDLVHARLAQDKAEKEDGIARRMLLAEFERWIQHPDTRQRMLDLEANDKADFRAKIEAFLGYKVKWHTPEDYAKWGVYVRSGVLQDGDYIIPPPPGHPQHVPAASDPEDTAADAMAPDAPDAADVEGGRGGSHPSEASGPTANQGKSCQIKDGPGGVEEPYDPMLDPMESGDPAPPPPQPQPVTPPPPPPPGPPGIIHHPDGGTSYPRIGVYTFKRKKPPGIYG